MKYALTPLLLLLLAACGNGDSQTSAKHDEITQEAASVETVEAGESETPAARLTNQDLPGAIEGREVREITLDEIKPPLPRGSSAMLNPITRRTQEISDAYVQNIKRIRDHVDAAVADGDDADARATAEADIEQLSTWRDNVAVISDEMDVEIEKIKASGESYNDALLYGVQSFPARMEEIIGKGIETLTAKLNGAENKAE